MTMINPCQAGYVPGALAQSDFRRPAHLRDVLRKGARLDMAWPLLQLARGALRLSDWRPAAP